MPVAPGLAQPWHASPRARPLTVLDFRSLCAEQTIRITAQMYADGKGRALAGRVENWRATTAIFELAGA